MTDNRQPDEQLDLDAIKRREAKATKGPWVYATEPGDHPAYSASYLKTVVWTHKGPGYGVVADTESSAIRPEVAAANADFIAHARTDVPRLVAAVEQRDAEIERLRAACDRLAQRCGFPIVEDREQMLGAAGNCVERLRRELESANAQIARLMNAGPCGPCDFDSLGTCRDCGYAKPGSPLDAMNRAERAAQKGRQPMSDDVRAAADSNRQPDEPLCPAPCYLCSRLFELHELTFFTDYCRNIVVSEGE